MGDVRRAGFIILVLVGVAFPAGLGLAVYVASGSSLVPPAVTARVPTGEIARPSTPPATTSATTLDAGTTGEQTTTTGTTDETTTTNETTTSDEEDEDSGRGRGRGRGRGGSDDD